MLDHIVQNVRVALRQMMRARTATFATILALGVGVGANTAMFSLLNATLFRPPPGTEPERLTWVASYHRDPSRLSSMSYPDYVDIRARATAFDDVLAYMGAWVSIGGSDPRRAPGQVVSGNYFDVLGLRAAVGRTFRSDEDSIPGASPVVVLSDALWKSRFAGNPAILDSTIIVNGHAFTIIGVMPPSFTGVELIDDEPVGMWLPFAMLEQAVPGSQWMRTSRGSAGLNVIGRLKPDATLTHAKAEVERLSELIGTEAGRDPSVTAHFTALRVAGGMDPHNRSELTGPAVLLLLAVPLLVLVVACGNAANVLLARALERRKELAVRRALGASRARLVGQLLTESVLMALFASVAAVLFSYWFTALITRLSAIPPTIAAVITPDSRVLLATLALALLTGVLFGLAPALAATRPALMPALKSDTATFALARTRHRLRDSLVIGQVAVSLTLLITAGLFGQSLSRMLRVDPGFSTDNGLTAWFDLRLQGYGRDERLTFEKRLLDAARQLPGVQSAALASAIPLGGRFNGSGVQPAEAPADGRRYYGYVSSTTPGYFATMGIRILRGRDFTEHDAAGATSVAIVNASLAREMWGTDDVIGKRFRRDGDSTIAEIVGVSQDGKYGSLTDDAANFFFVPQLREAAAPLALVIRTAGTPTPLRAGVTQLVRDLDANLPVFNIRAFDDLLIRAANERRMAASMLGVFGMLTLMLASLGMYAVTAHGVALRTREIGIRMSLGARVIDVVTLFVREGLMRSAVGVGIGLALSVAVWTLLSGFLFGLVAADLLSFMGGATLLCAIAVFASYVPARRVAKVDPLVALRSE